MNNGVGKSGAGIDLNSGTFYMCGAHINGNYDGLKLGVGITSAMIDGTTDTVNSNFGTGIKYYSTVAPLEITSEDGMAVSVSYNQNGGIFCDEQTTLNVDGWNTYFLENSKSSDSSFGAIYSKGKITLKNVGISDCSSTYGGAVYLGVDDELTMDGVSISGCSAKFGGAIFTDEGAKVTLEDVTISDCTASSGSGAIEMGIDSVLSLSDGSISGCNALDGAGGIYLGSGHRQH